MRRALLALIVSLLCAVGLTVLPADALASGGSAYTKVSQALSRSSTGALAPCDFSSAELKAALNEAPTYDLQYGADITNAIQAALAARANGACSAGHTGTRTSTTAAGGVSSGATLKGGGQGLPGTFDAGGSGGLPLVLIVVFSLAGACLVVLAAWVGISALGYDPRLGRAARHSLREAEYRMGAGWDDLTDRLRRQ